MANTRLQLRKITKSPIFTAWYFFMGSTCVAMAEDWPQWMGRQRDNIWRETKIIESFSEDGAKVLWRHPIGGGYSGPAVAKGRVYLTDFRPELQSGEAADQRRHSRGIERIVCLDEADGNLLWEHSYPVTYSISYPAGPRCTPNVDDSRVYTLGAQGDLKCLDANTGEPRWACNLPREYSTKPAIWGYAGHPLVVGDNLICIAGGTGSLVVAFDKYTGKENWRALSSSGQGYSPPLLLNSAGTDQLIIFHPDGVSSLAPSNGKEYWTVKYQATNGSVIMSPIKSGNMLYAAGYTKKNLMVKLSEDKPEATVVWQDIPNAAISPVNVQPIAHDGMLYGFHQDGTLLGVDFKTGARLWSSLEPLQSERPLRTGTAFIVRQEDRYWLFTEHGDLVIAKMNRRGYEELDRTHVLAPTDVAFGRKVVWAAPAFANRKIFLRNGNECICVDASRPPSAEQVRQ
ncbi:MAG: PQQ-like beta-propeller repeat protein [Rubripirellula sp.]|nr:PQQ-like beta-propeller repeat protein [Rubripirellula sp.]